MEVWTDRPPSTAVTDAPAAQMGDDEAEISDSRSEEARSPGDRPLDRQAVESEPTDAVALGPRVRQRIPPRRIRQGRVERGVEDGHVGDRRQALARGPDGGESPLGSGAVPDQPPTRARSAPRHRGGSGR